MLIISAPLSASVLPRVLRIMMRLGARHLNVQKRRYCYGYLSQNLRCGVTRGVTRSCLRRLAPARCYAGALVSTGRYQVRESWRKCPRLFPYCDVDSALGRAYSGPSPLRTLLRTLIPLASANPRVVRLYDRAAASAAETRLAALVASASLASAAKKVERSARRSPTLCRTSRSRSRSVDGHATGTYPSAICSSVRRPCALRARDT